MPLPSKRHPEQLAHALESWFSKQLSHQCRITDVGIPEGTGMSSETLLFTLHYDGKSEPIVARLNPDVNDWPVFPVYDLTAQAGAMRLIAACSDVPVPNVRFLETDQSILGSPFLVMDRVSGRALPDMPPYVFGGSYMDALNVQERRELGRQVIRLQARIHAINLDDAAAAGFDLSFLPKISGDAIDRLLNEQRSYYDWARGDLRLPIIEKSLQWLADHKPENPGPTVLNWGDARPGNVLFDGLNATAVLDWEMINVGPAGIDVGWLIFMHRFFQSLAEVFELPGFPEFCQVDDIEQAYAQAGGRPIDNLNWYINYASMRFASIAIRTSLRDISYGNREMPADPEDLIMHKAMLYSQMGD